MAACPVTDKALSAIAMALKNISELDVSECKLITADGIAVVSDFMTRLHYHEILQEAVECHPQISMSWFRTDRVSATFCCLRGSPDHTSMKFTS